MFSGVSRVSRVALRGCRGKEDWEVLQDLRAQVRKLRVRIFIVDGDVFFVLFGMRLSFFEVIWRGCGGVFYMWAEN